MCVLGQTHRLTDGEEATGDQHVFGDTLVSIRPAQPITSVCGTA